MSKKAKQKNKRPLPARPGAQKPREEGAQSKPSIAMALIAHGSELATQYLEHHFKLAIFVGAMLLLIVIVFLVVRRPSDCLDVDAHMLGTIRVGCSAAETPPPEASVDGLSGKQYTDRTAGFTLRLEEPSNWSILQAQNTVDLYGRPAKAFQFPRGLLGNKEVTFLTKDGVAAFINDTLLREGKANFWVYYIPNQTRPVEEFVSAETKNLLRTGSTVLTLTTPLALSDSPPSSQNRATGDALGRVDLTKMEVSPDHKQALLLWRSPYFGVDADIVARVVIGERDTYYAVAIRVAPDGQVEDKINHELRTMIESFRPLHFENVQSGAASRTR